MRLKNAQRQLEFLEIQARARHDSGARACACSHAGLGVQEEYVKDEMRNLKRELVRAKEVRARARLAARPRADTQYPPPARRR